MEWIKKCPVLFLLAVSGMVFSLVGMIGRSSVYKEYDFNIVERPFLALMMEGMSKKVAPWEVCGIGTGGRSEASAQVLAVDDGQDMEVTENGLGVGVVNGTEEGKAQAGVTDGMEEVKSRNGVTDGAEEAGAMAVGTGVEQGADGNVGGIQQSLGNNQAAGRPEMGQTAHVVGRDPAGMADDVYRATAATAYEFQIVTEDYFDDAVFIGDSRTVGLFEYAGLEDRADFFAKISLTIYDVFTEKVAKDERTGKKITVEEALSQKQYGKVYLMLGINEMGTGTTESFMKEYKAVVDRIRQLQPEAVIFVQGIMRVTGEKNERDPIFNNTNINERNAEIAKLADNEHIFYIDVNEVVCDEEGNLNEEYTVDEIHLKAKYYEIWKEFLLRHGVE